MRRYTRQEVHETMQQQLGNVTQRVTIDETPNELRHACPVVGVVMLPIQYFNVPVPTEDGGYTVNYPFYYCPNCGKLYVYRHLYD